MKFGQDSDVQLDEDLLALAAGKIGPGGMRFGSQDGHRSARRLPSTSRRRCGCGCGRRATHAGLGDGVALMSGCEDLVDLWILDPRDAIRVLQHG